MPRQCVGQSKGGCDWPKQTTKEKRWTQEVSCAQGCELSSRGSSGVYEVGCVGRLEPEDHESKTGRRE